MSDASHHGAIDVRVAPDGTVESSEGWTVRAIGADLLEYRAGSAACLVNVGYEPSCQARRVFATESASFLFPRLREHLERATRHFKGNYVVV
jgi:hypothetical protein